MAKLIDLTGMRFGRLTVVDRAGAYIAPSGKGKSATWNCLCDCGKSAIVDGHHLRTGAIRSCGCLRNEVVSARAHKAAQSAKKALTTHGACSNGKREWLYRIWCAMITRTENPNIHEWKSYGGRGIRICDEWRHNFSKFRAWAMKNGYADDLTIDRIDVNGNYEPANCRWATRLEQGRNTTRTQNNRR